MVSMKAFGKFENTTDALAAAATMVESKVGKSLKSFLKKHVKDETLAIAIPSSGCHQRKAGDRVRALDQRDGVDARGEVAVERVDWWFDRCGYHADGVGIIALFVEV